MKCEIKGKWLVAHANGSCVVTATKAKSGPYAAARSASVSFTFDVKARKAKRHHHGKHK
jgi:ribosomal protein S11